MKAAPSPLAAVAAKSLNETPESVVSALSFSNHTHTSRERRYPMKVRTNVKAGPGDPPIIVGGGG